MKPPEPVDLVIDVPAIDRAVRLVTAEAINVEEMRENAIQESLTSTQGAASTLIALADLAALLVMEVAAIEDADEGQTLMNFRLQLLERHARSSSRG